ncbi:MAG: NHL repeat-containing protein [Thermodesulfobacteriota bacterium]
MDYKASQHRNRGCCDSDKLPRSRPNRLAIALLCLLVLSGPASPLLAAEEEFYTVQLATFPDPEGAEAFFDRAAHSLPAGDQPFLRVELIGKHFTVRLGKCGEAAPCDDLLAAVKASFPGAYLMRAYFLPDRIRKMTEHQRQEQEAAPPVSPAAPLFSGTPIVSQPLPDESEEPAPAAEDADSGLSTAGIEDEPVEAEDGSATGGEDESAPPPPPPPQWQVTEMLTKDADGVSLQFPSAIFTDRKTGEFYVVDEGKGQIIHFGPDLFPEQNLGRGRGIYRPKGGAVAPDGRIFVCQAAGEDRPPRITVLSAAFFVDREIVFDQPEAAGFSPTKVTFAPDGTIYVVGSAYPGVARLGADGSFLGMLHTEDAEAVLPENKKGPVNAVPINDAIFDDQGRLYLLSEYLSRIYVYDQEGSLLFHFGTKGGSSGKLSRPQALTFDPVHRTVTIVDYMRNMVSVYDREGRYLYEFGGQGWGPGWFQYPVDIDLGPADTLIVADYLNHRLHVFAAEKPKSVP